MSNRWPQIHDPDEGYRGRRTPLRERYLPPQPEQGWSPVLIIVLIVAAFTCLALCVILSMTTFRLIFPT